MMLDGAGHAGRGDASCGGVRIRARAHVAGYPAGALDVRPPCSSAPPAGVGPPAAALRPLCFTISGGAAAQKDDHKSAYDIITEQPPEGLSPDEVQMVALIARYHRKKGPSLEHAPFARLSPPERETVRALSAILRVADGLDRGHRDAVRDLSAVIEPGRVCLVLDAPGGAELEIWGALRKADVFEKVFGVSLDIRVSPESH